MGLKGSLLIFLLSIANVLACGESPLCEDVPYGRICTRISPDLITIADDALLLVATKNNLYSFNTLPRLELKQHECIKPNNASIQQCLIDNSQPESECVNHIRILQQIPQDALRGKTALEDRFNDTILVCGTNAFYPKCTVHKRTNIKEWSYLTDSTTIDDGFSPYSTNLHSIGLLATNRKFYTGSFFGKFNTKRRIAVAPRPLMGDSNFVTSTFDNSPLWLSQQIGTKFISLYEIGEYVYYFVREPAFEVDEGKTVIYSRVIRICKTDEGITEMTQFLRFRTFQKARMTCPHIDNNIAPKYYYDDVSSTYLHWPDNSQLPILYATFLSADNGPEGSAICKFSFDPSKSESLVKGFQDGVYYVADNNGGLTEETEEPFACPGSPGRNRTDDDAKKFQLIKGDALPIGGGALFTVDGESYTQIAVDVFSYNSTTYEVIYAGTNKGSVKAFIHNTSNSGSQTVLKVYEPATNASPINQLILNISNENGIRRLYVTAENLLVDIILGNCSKYSSCVECLESKDPYCAWNSGSNNLCINKLVYNYTTKISEAIKPPSDITDFCGVLPSTVVKTTTSIPSMTTPTKATRTYTTYFTTTITVDTCTLNAGIKTILPSASRSTRVVIPTLSVRPSIGGVKTSPSKPAIGQLVGSLVGGLLLGFIIGIIVCFIGLALKRTFMKDNSSSPRTPDHSYNNGNGSVGQYAITVVLPEGHESEKSGDVPPPPPPPSVSPPLIMVDSELEDDAISDLPTSGPPSRSNSGRNHWSIPRGRTESTRWLRASESEASTNGTESPLSPS